MRHRVLTLASAVTLVMAAGCTSTATGAAKAPSSAQTTTAPFPPRPHSYNVTKVDPCALVPQGQRTVLGINRPQLGPEENEAVPGTTICTLVVTTWGSYGVTVDPTRSAADLIAPDDPNFPTTTSTIDGYGAVISNMPQIHSCTIAVDVSDTQSISVGVVDNVGDPDNTACTRTETAAKVVLATLATLQPS